MPNNEPYSQSRIKTFETCPRQYRAYYIDKDVKQSYGAAAEEGNRQHKAMEAAVVEDKDIEGTYAYLNKIMKPIRRLAKHADIVLCEYKMAIDKGLYPTTFNDVHAHIRGIADLVLIRNNHAAIVDYKSGKERNYNDQLELMAFLVSKNYPQLTKFSMYIVWTKGFRSHKLVLTKNEVNDIVFRRVASRIRRVQIAEENNIFMPNPSGLCRGWCPVKQCEHWKG